MRSFRFLIGIFLLVITCHAAPPMATSSAASSSTVAKDAINYTIRVEWKKVKKDSNVLQIVTSEGNFELDTVSGATKINDSDIPSTVKLSGTITEISPEKARLQLFLGRTVPYVTGAYSGSGGAKSSSYSQMSVGLQSTFIVTFGKPLVVQTDDNGTVTVLVKRGDE